MFNNDKSAIFPCASITLFADVRSEPRHTIAVCDLDIARPGRAITGFLSCVFGSEAN